MEQVRLFSLPNSGAFADVDLLLNVESHRSERST